MSSALLATRNAALAAPTVRTTSARRAGAVRVFAKGDGKRVERSNKRDVM